ncbi:MAG: hypothetical protein B7733_14800 [Myxococcales bacterium FL481]|nr:MAG: hypothetical protein B7733_14800 [Myxococcales bacterium FL481]
MRNTRVPMATAATAWTLLAGAAPLGCPQPEGAHDSAGATPATGADAPLVAPNGGSPPGTDSDDLALARADYAKYCAICHGETGEGYQADGANALAHPNFLASASDSMLFDAIAHGRVDTPMSAWSVNRAGPLQPSAIHRLVRLMRSWATMDAVDTEAIEVDGLASRGWPVWQVYCQDCHGEDGEGGQFMSVTAPNFLDHVTDGYLKYAVAKGRPGTPMPAYEHVLTRQELDDVVAMIRAWSWVQTPELSDYGDKLVNPMGTDPVFDADPRFVSVDTLKAALDAEAKLLILDARPPADFVTRHIQGAASLPFYEVEDHLDEIPRDVWIVTYCACPHAESEAAADVLLGAGFTNVRVLDEGFNVWVERGYPTAAGTR